MTDLRTHRKVDLGAALTGEALTASALVAKYADDLAALVHAGVPMTRLHAILTEGESCPHIGYSSFRKAVLAAKKKGLLKPPSRTPAKPSAMDASKTRLDAPLVHGKPSRGGETHGDQKTAQNGSQSIDEDEFSFASRESVPPDAEAEVMKLFAAHRNKQPKGPSKKGTKG